LESEGKIAEQERREFAGITAPKGSPKGRSNQTHGHCDEGMEK
jgi:hypothetical protein